VNKKLIIKGHDKNIFVMFWNFCWNIYYKNPEVWNYLIVGGLTTVVSLGVKLGLLYTVLNASNPVQLQTAVIIAWICAVAFAYVTNRVFVFHSKNTNYLKEIVNFVGGRILTLLMDMFIMWFFVTFLGLDSNMWVFIWNMVDQILITIGNYVISKVFVFKKEEK